MLLYQFVLLYLQVSESQNLYPEIEILTLMY